MMYMIAGMISIVRTKTVDRVTDHKRGVTLYKLDGLVQGEPGFDRFLDYCLSWRTGRLRVSMIWVVSVVLLVCVIAGLVLRSWSCLFVGDLSLELLG